MTKKICLLITGLSYGGAENQLLCMAKVLKKRGWDVHVVSMCEPRAYIEEFSKENIPVLSLNMTRKIPDPRALFCFSRFIKELQPHIVHSHMIHANIFARISRIIHRCSVLVCTAHNIYEGKKWREYAYRLTDSLCDLTTNVCRAGVEHSKHLKTVSPSKLKYVPNGVDRSLFVSNRKIRAEMREKMQFGDAFVFLAIGRIEEQKDYPNLLAAFAKIQREEPNVKLCIVGDGVLRKEMERLAEEFGIEHSLHFLGIRRDISSLMNATDGYVMSSAWEGMPIVLLEAAAMGLPIIATDVGGNADVVQNGVNGVLVPSKKPDLLAQAMISLTRACEKEHRKMSTAASEYIRKNYDIESIVDTWERIYKDLGAANVSLS